MPFDNMPPKVLAYHEKKQAWAEKHECQAEEKPADWKHQIVTTYTKNLGQHALAHVIRFDYIRSARRCPVIRLD